MRHPLHSTRVRIRAPRYGGAAASMEYLQPNHTKGTLHQLHTFETLRHPRQKDVGQALKLSHSPFLETALGHVIYLQTFEKDTWSIF